MLHPGRPAFAALFLSLFACTFVAARPPRPVLSRSGSDATPAISPNADTPIHFERNEGQTDPRVEFLARGRGYTLFLTPDEAVIALHRPKGSTQRAASAVVRSRLVGASPDTTAAGEEPLLGRSNYFLGTDPAKWRTGVRHFARVTYRNIWPGIDLSYYGAGPEELEYDFVVRPGADPDDIRLEYAGITSMELDARGQLVLHTGSGDIVQRVPSIHQHVLGERRRVAGGFVLEPPNRVRFRIAQFDRTLPLVIDPTLAYSTYLGGSSSEYAYAIAVDSARNAYVTGYTSSTAFPTQGAIQTDQTAEDLFVSKLSASGNTLIYSTYLGGGGTDVGQGIAVDSSGCAYVTGYTSSTDFPTQSQYQSDQTGEDAFAVKLSAAGDALTYSTYLGGSGADRGLGIAVDSSGAAFVTGYTESTNFPTVSAYESDQGGRDAFVTKLATAGNSLTYSTYLGGSSSDAGNAIAIDTSGAAFVCGSTDSSNFPTAGPYQTDQSFSDVFVTKLSADGTALTYSTYLGGSSSDYGYGIAVDASGSAYVTGSTDSTDFPTLNPYLSDKWTTDAFVTKLEAGGNTLVYSTYLGAGVTDVGRSIAVDTNGAAWVVGSTSSTDFPTKNAYQAYRGSTDAFVTKLASAGSSTIFSTYLGGTGTDLPYGVAVDGYGNAYVAGSTTSTDFPLQSAYQPAHAGGTQDAFVAAINGKVTIADVVITEGNSGTSNATFTVTLDLPSTGSVTVAFASSDGTGAAPADYQTVAGTLTFAPGETSKTVDVPIVGDTTQEPDETFTLTLSSPVGATIADGQATATILDDDYPPPVLTILDRSVTEGNSGTTLSGVTIRLSYARGVPVTVGYTTSNGTARAPADYTAASGTISIPAGSTETSLVMTTAGDTLVEQRETFTVTLSNPSAAVLGDGLAIVTIIDDDSTPPRTGDLAYDRNSHTATILPDGRVLTVSSGTAEIFDPARGTWSVTTAPPSSQTGHTAVLTASGKVMTAGGTVVRLFDPVASQWSSPPALAQTRASHTMTALRDGRVLIVGGYDRELVEIYTESGGSWARGTAGSLSPVRAEHTATRLADGRVLVAGGYTSSGNSLTNVDIFDPSTDNWTAAAPLATGRRSHTATLLTDGRVLIAGGYTSWSATSWTQSCEIYDPAAQTWTATANLSARGDHAAALLPTGEVIAIGGEFPNYTDIQIYSPVLGTWTSAGKTTFARRNATATLLTDGRVLVLGGNSFQEEEKGFTAEIVDRLSGWARAAATLTSARRSHSATLLPDGNVLVVGGGDASYELFDRGAKGTTGSWIRVAEPLANRSEHRATLLPNGSVLVTGGGPDGALNSIATTATYASGTWTSRASMSTARRGHTATLLADGTVLVTGGLNTWATSLAETFDGTAWTRTPNMAEGRWHHTATRLPSGEVLVAGGMNSSISGILRSAEIFNPISRTWRAAAPMSSRRTGHVAVLLRDGRVLVAGGEDSWSGPLTSAEIYDPSRDAWTTVASMARARTSATATLLWNGRVVVAGGEAILSELDDLEVYDPLADRWTASEWGLPGRFSHSATLLATGEILFAGGEQTTGPPLAQTSLFDPMLFESARAPQIASVTTPIQYGTAVSISGSSLRGNFEASGGDTRSSAVDLPVVELRSVEEPRIIPLSRDAMSSPYATIAISRLPSTLDAGWHYVRVVTSGVASDARLVNVACSVRISSVSGPSAPVTLGQPATFSVETEGARRYQWQRCITGTCTQDTEWSDITGATSATYTTTGVTGADSGRKFRVKVEGNCASETSSAVTLTVADSGPPAGSIVYPTGGEYWLLSPTDGNPANARVVTWSMTDDVRICRVEVSLLYSNDGGASYAAAPSGGGLPATFGSGGNCVYPGVSTMSLTYTVPTAFPSGRSGSLYKIRVVVTDQAGNAATIQSTNPFYIVQPNPDSVKTLILWNRARMIATQGLTTTQADQLGGKLQELANHPRVLGLVVDLGTVTSITNRYTTWDGESSNSTKANEVLFASGGVHDYLLSNLLTAYSGVRYLVIIGNDRIIPMARVADRTVLLPESSYPAGGDLSPTATTAGQALSANKYLTDDPLAVLDAVSTSQIDGSVFIPDLAVGRLVETQAEIITTIATYISQDGILDLSLLNASTGHKVLVTGYDFLSNASRHVRARWKSALGVSTADDSIAPVDGSLIGSTWNLGSVSARTTALRTAMAGNGGTHYGVMAIAGHATHYEEGVPGTNPFDIQGLSTADLYGTDACSPPTASLGAVDLSGSIVYAVGCHGGLSVPGSCRTDANRSLDLPQTFLSRGAVAYVANSGYGWALKFGIGYGARMMQIFTEQITAGGTLAVGDVVRQTKQRYFLEAPRYDAYDEKSLMQWTLYGLPMYAVKSGIAAGSSVTPATNQAAASGEQRLGDVRVRRELVRRAPRRTPEDRRRWPIGADALPSSLTQLNLSFDFTAAGVFQKHDSSGALLAAGPGCPDANGCYYTLNGLVDRGTGSGDLPIQPYLIYDSRLSGSSQHGVLWKGGTYDEESGWTPVIAELVSNGGDGSNHGATMRVASIRPTDPRIVPGADSPTCRPSDLELNSLTVTAGEAVKNEAADATYSITRRYRNIDLEVYYFNNQSTPTDNCDRTGPTLGAGPFAGAYHQKVGSSLAWAVPATDAAGVWRVVVVYNPNTVDGNGRGTWTPLDLTNDGTGTFRGSVSVAGVGRMTYMLQAVDNRGNITWLDFVTTSLPASGVPLGLPLAIDVTSLVAPAGVTATASTATSVAVTWTSVAAATSYDVYRSSSGTNFAKIGSSTTTSFNDGEATAGQAYLYAVKALDASSASALSSPDLATTVIFTDATLAAGATVVKAVHVTELRTAVDAVRRLAGLGAFPFSDAPLGAGTPIRAVHVADLRTGLDAARSALGLAALTYTDASLTAGTSTVKATHLTELRNGVR